jgi:Ca2+/Na+ antiporter
VMQVALGFTAVSITRHILVVPLWNRWRLTRASAAGMFAFYAVFQVVYLLLIVREKR